MYLLKPDTSAETLDYKEFTFHYVSIKTNSISQCSAVHMNLHSTMYLLKQKTILEYLLSNDIYIPLCIY